MDQTNTNEPLAAYIRTGSETAFRELVHRYLDFVYSIALRKLGGDSHLAEDVAQQVFTELAQKAATLPADVTIGGWLHRHTCFVASKLVRSEVRRRTREQQAAEMNTNDSDATWKQLAPVLDDAIEALESSDREAILLRFFAKCDFRSVGVALGVSDDTAQKRVSRALDKLRTLLVHRGVALSGAALGAVLADRAVAYARTEFSAVVADVALGKLQGAPGPGGLFRTIAARSKLAWMGSAAGLLGVLTVFQVLTSDKPFVTEGTSESKAIAEARTNIGSVGAGARFNAQEAGAQSNRAASAAVPGDTASLTLVVVAADSSKPIPNVPIEFRLRANGDFKKSRNTSSDRLGVCKLSIPAGVDHLELTTRKDGFADTKLEWWTSRGDVIPTNYVLRLERPIRIGGRVMDEKDQPVQGASVYFGCNADLSLRKGPESHDFTWVGAKTDAEGRWELNRIAGDAWSRAFGYATHTNYADDHLGQILPAEAAQQLRAGTHVFRLKETITVRGEVVDSHSHPVGGAKVVINNDDDHAVITAADGTFAVDRRSPGLMGLTVEAEGFAGAMVRTQCYATSAPVRVVLQRGQPLLLRIVDKAGQPATNATVQLRMAVRTHDATVFQRFTPDAEGRVVWKSAPDEEMLFSVFGKGYGEEAFVARPDGTERVITLLPATVVRGSVRDDAGELLPVFRVAIGHPRVKEGKTNVQWGLNPEQWLSFNGGKYEHHFEHWSPVDLSVVTNNSGYILKFEAEDHAPFISRLIQPTEGEVQLDVILQRASATKIRIISPAGELAEGAEVALVTGGMSRQGIASGKFGSVIQGGRLRANERGEFQLPPDTNIEKVVVTHVTGFQEIEAAELRSETSLELQAWGKIEGTFSSRGKQVAGVRMHALRQSEHVRFELEPVTDSQGRFYFSQVPPGEYKLHWRMPQSSPSAESHSGFSKSVMVRPGQTATVDIGVQGYAVTARVRWPEGFKRDSRMKTVGAVTSRLPGGLQQQLALAFSAKPEATIYFGLSFNTDSALVLSPEFRRTLVQANHYAFQANPDGSFLAEGVESGRALITFMVIDRAESERQGKVVVAGCATASIDVPADPPTGTMDLGEVELVVPASK